MPGDWSAPGGDLGYLELAPRLVAKSGPARLPVRGARIFTLHLAETATRPGERMAAVACAIMPLFVGWLTRTDTFNLVIVAAATIFVVLKLRTWLALPGRT